MVGSSSTSAPRLRNRSASARLRSRGLVTIIFLPNSVSFSYQLNSPASPQTSPTTMIAGVSSGFFFTSSGSFSSVLTIRLCFAVVPRLNNAAGVSFAFPPLHNP